MPRAAVVVALAVLTVFLVVTGLMGADFGAGHWDEPVSLGRFFYAVNHGGPWPRDYGYPTGVLAFVGISALPDLFQPNPTYDDFLIRAREVLIVVTSLTVLASYGLARALGRPRAESVLAAALVATSFELATHMRFVATDALTTLFTTTSLACLVAARTRPRLLWLAAIACGFAASTKYSAGVLGVAVVVGALMSATATRERLTRAALAVVVMGLAFVLLTPGAVKEPELIVAALRYQSRIYGGGFLGYSVDGPLAMLGHIARYLLAAVPSPFLAISLLSSLASLCGVVVVIRAKEQRVWLLPLVFVVSFLALFLVQHTFIPRNFLPLFPVLAALAARAAGFAFAGARIRQALVVLACSVVVVVDAGALAYAAGTIRDRKTPAVLDEVAAFVDAHPDRRFLVSPVLMRALTDRDGRARVNLVTPPNAQADDVIAWTNELLWPWQWSGGDPFLFARVFGEREVNLSLYPTWLTPHVVMMSIDDAKAVGASLDLQPPPSTPPRFDDDPATLHPEDRPPAPPGT